MHLYWLVILGCFLLPQCSRPKKIDGRQSLWRESNHVLHDVPLPFYNELQHVFTTDSQAIISYKPDMPLGQLSEWYCYEMERAGWRLMVRFEQPNLYLVFEKPTRICILEGRQQRQGLYMRTITSEKCSDVQD